MSPDFVMPPSARIGDIVFGRGAWTPHTAPSFCGMPTPATTRVVQMEPGPWPTLMQLAPASARKATPSALVTLPAIERQVLELLAQQHAPRPPPPWNSRAPSRPPPRRLLHPPGGPHVRRCGRHRASHRLCGATQSPLRMKDGKRASRAGFTIRVSLVLDALDVAQGKETAQPVLVIDDQQLVNADVVGEKPVRRLDRILAGWHFPAGCRPRSVASWPRAPERSR